jgi:hypothetical protein
MLTERGIAQLVRPCRLWPSDGDEMRWIAAAHASRRSMSSSAPIPTYAAWKSAKGSCWLNTSFPQ